MKNEHELTILKCCISSRLLEGRMGSRKKGSCDYPGKRLRLVICCSLAREKGQSRECSPTCVVLC